jgi:hypothetical protein
MKNDFPESAAVAVPNVGAESASARSASSAEVAGMEGGSRLFKKRGA